MRKIGLVVKDQKDSLSLAREMYKYLVAKGLKVMVDEESSEKTGLTKGCIIDKMDVDLFVVLGGDGTILKTVSMAKDKKTPILGINFGTTGFLTQISPGEWKNAINNVIRGRYTVEGRAKLEVRLKDGKGGSALNECVIITSVPVEVIVMELYVDGALTRKLKADGVIISTPTGSTAYSKSCGGPIVDPRMKCFVITPICPFEGSSRSLVVPQDSKIDVRVLGKSRALVVIDGEKKLEFPSGTMAAFSISDEMVNFIELEGDYYSKIRDRL
jgi:NAD+ kinase